MVLSSFVKYKRGEVFCFLCVDWMAFLCMFKEIRSTKNDQLQELRCTIKQVWSM